MTDAAPRRDPGRDFGRLMGTVWILFLGFPIASLLVGPHPPGVKALGLAGLALFAGIYLATYARAYDDEAMRRRVTWRSCVALASMAALTATEASLLGLGAIGLLTFIISLGMFILPLRWAWVVAAVCNLLTVALPLAAGQLHSRWFFILVNVSVTVAVAASRNVVDKAEEIEATNAELAIASDRERVARDVHDVLGHSLTVITLKSELAERLVEADPERARAELREINELSRAAIGEVRATVTGLRVRTLEAELQAARHALASAGIAADLPSDARAVPVAQRPVVGWALREAVTNVVRHSGASGCAVILKPGRLAVTDDGRGLAGGTEGNGLRGMRERVDAAGGGLALGPGPDGRGTRVEVTW